MIRHCNGSDPHLKNNTGNVGNCGATFDDVNHWTICPHEEFPINPAVWELLARQDAALKLPGEVAGDGPPTLGEANDGPGDGWHQHDDGSWHPDDDNIEGRKNVANARYLAAAHAVQSGIAFLMLRNKRLGEAKHLRVGIDTMKVEQGALATLLIAKGVFTEVEYYEAMADAMDREKAMNEAQLSEMAGRPVSLS